MVGSFGDMIFSVSEDKVYSFANFQRSRTATWKEHSRYGKKPVSEFVGPGLQSSSLEIHLDANLGVNPRTEIGKWGKICDKGLHDVLVVGNKQVGNYDWKIESVSEAWNIIMNKGELISADLSITLSEYVEDETTTESTTAVKALSATTTTTKTQTVTSLTKGSTYKVKTMLTGYYTSMEAKNLTATNRTGKVYPGTYYVYNIANGMINVTKVKGSPGSWINPSKNK